MYSLFILGTSRRQVFYEVVRSLNYNVWYRQGQFTYQGRQLSLEPSTGTSRLLTCPAKRNWISVLLIASSSSSIAFPKGNKLSFALRLSEAT